MSPGDDVELPRCLVGRVLFRGWNKMALLILSLFLSSVAFTCSATSAAQMEYEGEAFTMCLLPTQQLLVFSFDSRCSTS